MAGDAPSPATSRAAAFLLGLSLLGAACGGSTSTTQAPVSSASPDAPSTTASREQPTIDVQGHRGARGLRPENTLPAFEVALDLMVTTLELDLHFTADDRVVVWHDPEITSEKCGRSDSAAATTTPDPDSAPAAELRIRRLTADQLAGLRCDRNPDAGAFPHQSAEPTTLAESDFSVVTLDELFDFVARYGASDAKTEAQRANAATVQFNIETKRKVDQPSAIDDGFDGIHAGPFELAVLDVVASRGIEDRVVIQSFDHRSLTAIRAIDDDIRLAALTSRIDPDLETYAGFGAAIWSPNRRDVTGARIGEAHALGLLVIPWTVNEPGDMRTLVRMGVDGLISDRPDLVIDEIGAR